MGMIETSDSTAPVISTQRPRPLESLLASAKRMTESSKIKRAFQPTQSDWQSDAWDMYDLVGEQRFLTTTVAGRLAQARFFVGTRPATMTDDVEPVEPDHTAAQAFQAMSDRPASFVQMIYRLAINLSIPGEAYLVGTPDPGVTETFPDDDDGGYRLVYTSPLINGYDDDHGEGDGISNRGVRVEDLNWRAASIDEIEVKDGNVVLKLDPNDPETYPEDSVFLIRVWRPHPRRWIDPDSPTRSSLPVLRELVALTMDISAKVDSRLAGAGLLLVPESARQMLARAPSNGGAVPTDADPLTEALIEAMVTPINDRSSAAAVVPLVLSVPDESIEAFRHMTFSTPLDATAHEQRDEAIRRLALGQDCPPELLMGVGSMNHWGAWLVREDVVTTHIEPTLALICDALTTEYLWPVLTDPEGLGMADDEARQYVIWYSVDHLIVRPNRIGDAKELHAAGALTDSALRKAAGFDESDAPERKDKDEALDLVISMVTSAPSLAQEPGIPALLAQIKAALSGGSMEELPPVEEGPQNDDPDAADEVAEDTGGDSIPDPDESVGPEILEEATP